MYKIIYVLLYFVARLKIIVYQSGPPKEEGWTSLHYEFERATKKKKKCTRSSPLGRFTNSNQGITSVHVQRAVVKRLSREVYFTGPYASKICDTKYNIN
jgi:hypothetical protein